MRPPLTRVVCCSSFVAMLLVLAIEASASAAPHRLRGGFEALVSSAARHATTAGGATEGVTARRISPRMVVAFAAGNRTELPDDPSADVVLGAIKGGPRLRLSLPRHSLRAGPSVDSWQLPYGKRAAIAVQPLTDGSLRAAVVVAGATAPKSYAFRLTLPRDVGAVRNADGGVDLVRRSPGRKVVGTLLVGRLEVPWAVDANGRAIRTWYTVGGNTVIQHIDFGAASAFPIVADPRIVWHW